MLSVALSLQVDGSDGLARLFDQVFRNGRISSLYQGSLATMLSTFVANYPWFYVYNTLDKAIVIPKYSGIAYAIVRSACMGFVASLASDTVLFLCAPLFLIFNIYIQSIFTSFSSSLLCVVMMHCVVMQVTRPQSVASHFFVSQYVFFFLCCIASYSHRIRITLRIVLHHDVLHHKAANSAWHLLHSALHILQFSFRIFCISHLLYFTFRIAQRITLCQKSHYLK
jgi:hypothetical protein